MLKSAISKFSLGYVQNIRLYLWHTHEVW